MANRVKQTERSLMCSVSLQDLHRLEMAHHVHVGSDLTRIDKNHFEADPVQAATMMHLIHNWNDLIHV
jgi:hypothetical protein